MSTVDLWDWRCRVADLYARIRATDDPQVAWQLWRETRDLLFKTHSQSPIDDAASYVGVPLFPYEPALRFLVTLDPIKSASIRLPAGDDGEVEAIPFAVTRGLAEPLGGELTLYWLGGYGGGAFLPFTDATSGAETYGGGRYLLDSIKSADLGRDGDGRIILDFNFAYAPSCAHSARFICPLAPRNNRLPQPVRGGERNGGGTKLTI